MGWTAAYDQLVKKRPSSSLVSAANITSLLIHVAIVTCIQAVAFALVHAQPWSVDVANVLQKLFYETFVETSDDQLIESVIL